jgi:crotonobetainyl-CoA hydratase
MTKPTTEPSALTEPAALYEQIEHIAVITLNRPRALNAVNAALSLALGSYLDQADADPDVRVIVLTGAGRAFCAGGDLKEIATGIPLTALGANPEWGFAGITQHWVSKPIIAAVNGFAMGGGTEIALACDLIVAAEDAVFGLPEVKRGLFAAAGGVVRLPRQIPIRRAMQLALTGDSIDAATAESWGLVNVVAPAGDALSCALELARRIAGNAPLSVQVTKRLLHETASAGSDWDATWSGQYAWTANDTATAEIFASRDAVEGATAFAEKRPPVWEGR